MAKYINPFTDWGFKRLFGQEFSKDLLISFLNDLFEGEFQVRDVTFKDKEQLADSKDLRGCIYDVYCETDEGKHFIVEMQNNWTVNFVNRTLCYASKAITNQREKEKSKDKPSFYELVPVYVISFMNFSPHVGEEISLFKSDVMLREKNALNLFTFLIYLSSNISYTIILILNYESIRSIFRRRKSHQDNIQAFSNWATSCCPIRGSKKIHLQIIII